MSVRRLLVIADDLSGAAEIAGIGHRFGLPTIILRAAPTAFEVGAGLTVLDTDTRSLPQATALHRIEPFLWSLRTDGGSGGALDLIFKKTDSVLRGNVAAEATLVRHMFDRRRVMLVPQNPSRGRTISRDGTYTIDGVPLDRTDFARDPEYPARSADALALLHDPWARCLGAGDALPEKGIVIGAAESVDDVQQWASRIDPAVDLPAGSGDFFTALMGARGLKVDRADVGLSPGQRLFVCGSASDTARALPSLATSRNVALCPMPDDVFAARAPVDAWATHVTAALANERHERHVLAFIPQPLDRAACARLGTAVADLVAAVLARTPVANLLLEGGATAAAVCRRMAWDALDVSGELAPGVVKLRAGGQTLIIKPGSYPWPPGTW